MDTRVEYLTEDQVQLQEEMEKVAYEIIYESSYGDDKALMAKFVARDISEEIIERMAVWGWRKG
jgi:hypothetical protein